MSIITYHEWAEKVGYIQNKDWTNLPDARKMLDRRDDLLDKEVKNGLTPEEKQELETRYNLENERYFKVYGIHKEDLSNYDLVIDTTNRNPEDIANEIIEKYNSWLAEK